MSAFAFYSDAFSADGSSVTSPTKDNRSPYINQNLRFSRVNITGLFLTTGAAAILPLPSHARIVQMYISGGDQAAAGAANIGLHKANGSVIDADLFATAVAKNADRVDCLIEATTLTNLVRGDYLWEYANAGAGTYTEDPNENWVVTLTASTNFTTTANSFVFEFWTIDP